MIIHPDGRRQRAQPNFIISNGYEVLRLLNNGDRVIINRQPTLRVSNMVSMKVCLITSEVNVITVHPAVLSCFDGDLDGDEINGCIPSSYMELELEKMKIENILIDKINNSLTAEIVQDAMLGCALYHSHMTKKLLHRF